MEGIQLKDFKGNDSRGKLWTKPWGQVRDTPADIADYVDMVYIDRRNDAEFKALGNKAPLLLLPPKYGICCASRIC